MRPLPKAAAVAMVQVLIVCSVAAKLLYDRRTLPQAWFKAERYDPDLPIRGRYLSLQIELEDPRSAENIEQKFGKQIPTDGMNAYGHECGSIVMRGSKPTTEFDSSFVGNCDNLTFARRHVSKALVQREGDVGIIQNESRLGLSEAILFFIADTAKDPTQLSRGDELWVLATVPRKGPPRPITLGVKKVGATVITPLNLN